MSAEETIPLALLPIGREAELKTCISCESLRGNRTHEYDEQDWECFKAPTFINVVSGKKLYTSCHKVRTNAEQCGIAGAWYKEYVKSPVYDTLPAGLPTSKPKKNIDLGMDE